MLELPQRLTRIGRDHIHNLIDARGVSIHTDRLVETDEGAGPLQCRARLEDRPDELAQGARAWVVIATGHKPDNRV